MPTPLAASVQKMLNGIFFFHSTESRFSLAEQGQTRRFSLFFCRNSLQSMISRALESVCIHNWPPSKNRNWHAFYALKTTPMTMQWPICPMAITLRPPMAIIRTVTQTAAVIPYRPLMTLKPLLRPECEFYSIAKWTEVAQSAVATKTSWTVRCRCGIARQFYTRVPLITLSTGITVHSKRPGNWFGKPQPQCNRMWWWSRHLNRLCARVPFHRQCARCPAFIVRTVASRTPALIAPRKWSKYAFGMLKYKINLI